MNNKKQKFTIIELLVVITIIAILAAILMPALISARKKAKMITCINRQKQIATAFMMYASDFDGFAYGGPEWATAIMPESVVKPYREAGQLAWAGSPEGQGYLRGEEILFCPEEKIAHLGNAAAYGKALSAPIGGETPFRFTTIGTIKNPDQASPPLPIPFKKYISPSISVLGGDSGILGVPSGNEYAHFSGITTTYPHITMRHKNNANVFMADGHVTSVGKELKDYFFYNIRGSAYQNDKFTTAIKNGEIYNLD
jgi:prepilin-type processing-associated H-X9-DG protein/prepilin-type N-terminal cleavage/methylation domain-containing protein